jgi:hypothetical protein
MAGLIQPIVSNLIPPQSRFRTVLTTLGAQISSKVEAVRYAVLPPEVQETGNKVAYIEMDPSDLTIESIMSSQRSMTPMKIMLGGFIRTGDPLIGVDFIDELLSALLTSTAVQNCNNAFGTNDGFSIEKITGITWAYGEDVGTQVRMTIEISEFHDY